MLAASRFVSNLAMFMAYLNCLNKRLFCHRWVAHDKQLQEIRGKYETYGRMYHVDFDDLIDQLVRLSYQEARLVVLAPQGVSRMMALREWRQKANKDLLARLFEADVTALMTPDENDLDEMVIACNFMQEQVLERSQMIGQALIGTAQHVLAGEIDLACETLEGLIEYVRINIEHLEELSL